jgi:hypothetical protein
MTSETSHQPWPPREGRPFFLLWLAGLLVFAVISRAAMFAASGSSGPLNAHGKVVFVVFALALHGWQAWLLFRPGWRRAVWTALPLLSLVAGTNYKFIQMLGIIAPLIETALLAGMRMRAWAWLLAGMGQVLLNALGGAVAGGLVALVTNSPLGRVPGISSPLIYSALFSGIWLLGEIAAAYVLAFWMPPITRADRTDSPPPPGSTSA